MKNTVNKRFILVGGLSILLICSLFYILSGFLYKLKNTGRINNKITTRLIDLASKSLIYGDVPVGAVILYNDTIIGTGYNTVRKDSAAYGHAEINALNEVIKKYGIENYSKLDKDKLVLITTLEPCNMCKGAIIEYRVKHVKFMMDKSFRYWYRENKKCIQYDYEKSKIEGSELQDSLFKLHPEYKGN